VGLPSPQAVFPSSDQSGASLLLPCYCIFHLFYQHPANGEAFLDRMFWEGATHNHFYAEGREDARSLTRLIYELVLESLLSYLVG